MKQLDLEKVIVHKTDVVVADGQLADMDVAVPPVLVAVMDDKSQVMNGVSGLLSHRPAVMVVHVVACNGNRPWLVPATPLKSDDVGS